MAIAIATAIAIVQLVDLFIHSSNQPLNGISNILFSLHCLVLYSIGLIVGMVICSILMGVISSSVNTTIVCFADGPAEFEENHPELSAEMRRTYQEVYPGY